MTQNVADRLEVRDLSVTYATGGGPLRPKRQLRAVQQMSFQVHRGRTLGIVGESGCGKSSLARALIGLAPVSGGEIDWLGQRISGLPEQAFRPFRKDIQMVFQDPFAALNPRLKVVDLIAEPLRTHMPGLAGTKLRDRVGEVLATVGLPTEIMGRFRHELSGGQAQRVGIARAIVTNPSLLICDEAVSALDVSVQALILNLFRDLQERMNFAMIFISHDLGVVKYICDDVLVLYLGRIMEAGPCDQVLTNPRHPYTRLLLQSSLSPADAPARVAAAKADTVEPPSPLAPPTGCPFRTRCARATATCEVLPPLRDMGPGKIACHFPLDQTEAT